MGFYDIISNISVWSWRSVLLMEETGVPCENHRAAASHNVISGTSHHSPDLNSQLLGDILSRKVKPKADIIYVLKCVSIIYIQHSISVFQIIYCIEYICHRNSYFIKKYRCYWFHSFIYAFIVPSYSSWRMTVTDNYANTLKWHDWHENLSNKPR
jgi:hypothetical protein